MQNFSSNHKIDIRLPYFPSHSGFFVLLRHDRADERGFPKPYHIEPLARYGARPPGNPAFKLFGVYVDEIEALIAMREDAKRIRSSMRRAP